MKLQNLGAAALLFLFTAGGLVGCGDDHDHDHSDTTDMSDASDASDPSDASDSAQMMLPTQLITDATDDATDATGDTQLGHTRSRAASKPAYRA